MINFSKYKNSFKGDLTGGLTAAIIALPMGLAFGLQSGLKKKAKSNIATTPKTMSDLYFFNQDTRQRYFFSVVINYFFIILFLHQNFS